MKLADPSFRGPASGSVAAATASMAAALIEMSCLASLKKIKDEKLEILVSLISMFIPTKDEAEISAYTLPKYRQKGYFKNMPYMFCIIIFII